MSLSFDISFLIQIILLVLIIMVITNITLLKSLLATFLGAIVLSIGEVVLSPIILKLSGLNLQEIMNSKLLILFIPLPQITMTLIIIYFCIRNKFYLFNFSETIKKPLDISRRRRKRTIVGLVLIQLTVFLVQITFNIFVVNKENNILEGHSLITIGYFSSAILTIGVISMIYLIIKLVDLNKKESQYHAQSIYIDTLDELYTAIRSERHDIINHFQTIYGFNQLGYTNEVQNYLSELLGGNILSKDFIMTGTPGLTALFYIKSSVAKNNEIEFKVNVNEQIINLEIPPYELNTILGNLINNAFDAVMNLEISQRITNVDIGADGDNYLFKVSNYGHINEAIKSNIMQKGYSTKQGEHSGLGLHICNTLIKKYNGHMEINNVDNQMVEFVVHFSRNLEKGKQNELFGQKTSTYAV